eukprot:7380379-Prymnesium_polylepis.1
MIGHCRVQAEEIFRGRWRFQHEWPVRAAGAVDDARQPPWRRLSPRSRSFAAASATSRHAALLG